MKGQTIHCEPSDNDGEVVGIATEATLLGGVKVKGDDAASALW